MNGSVRPGSVAAASVGSACSPLGAQAYNATTGAPMYCSSAAVWTMIGSSNFGVGQSWQNLSGSRANNTTYTNSSGNTIVVSANGACNGNYSSYAYVSGFAIQGQSGTGTGSGYCFFSFVVPPGATYSVNFYGGMSSWFEMR